MMNMKDDAKFQILARLKNVIKGQAMFVRDDTILDATAKCSQLDVLLDLANYIENYDEYSQVLETYRQKQKTVISER